MYLKIASVAGGISILKLQNSSYLILLKINKVNPTSSANISHSLHLFTYWYHFFAYLLKCQMSKCRQIMAKYPISFIVVLIFHSNAAFISLHELGSESIIYRNCFSNSPTKYTSKFIMILHYESDLSNFL